MLLTWVLLGMVVAAAGVITLAVVISASVIRELLGNSDIIDDGFSAKVESKIQDGNHTIIKVNCKNKLGQSTKREIRSEKGANVSVGQTIYKK